MKAVRIHEHGGLERLEYGEYAQPELGPSDVLVRVLASSVSRWDLKYRAGAWRDSPLRGLPGRNLFPLPMQPGRDAVGVVEAVGPNVRAFVPGDRVAGLPHPANPMSPMTMRGLGNLSTQIDYPGHTMFGGNAQYVARPESYWLPLPAGVEPSVAAAALWSYATAHRILAARIEVKLGDTIFVSGGSGGMGSATLDLARAMGIRVVTATRSAGKVAFLRALGACEVVLLPAAAAEHIRAATTGALGVDAAIEYTGEPEIQRLCIDVLRSGGTLVPVAGDLTTERFPITVQDCVRLEINLKGARGSNLNDQRIVLELLARGAITPAIHTVLPLSEIRRAHAMLESGEVTGRIILDPWS
jgi:NADPH:quinone reductase-like Zn-dependent oxidoreductase